MEEKQAKIVRLQPMIIVGCLHCPYVFSEYGDGWRNFWKRRWTCRRTNRTLVDFGADPEIYSRLQTIPDHCPLEDYDAKKNK